LAEFPKNIRNSRSLSYSIFTLFYLHSQKGVQKVKIAKGPIFSPNGKTFLLDGPEYLVRVGT
jgi:hypothetical protein